MVAVLVFAAFAAAGLPINTRYAFGASAILCLFCGAGVFGWTALDAGDRRRRWWMAGSAVVALALIAYAPAQYRSAHTELTKLARENTIEEDLLTLVASHAINLRCGPVGVPNHAPIPLLALYLKTSPANILSAQVGPHPLRRLRGPGQRGGRKGLRARPARPASAGQRAARVHRVGRQQLVADLHALRARRVSSEEWTVHPLSKPSSPGA